MGVSFWAVDDVLHDTVRCHAPVAPAIMIVSADWLTDWAIKVMSENFAIIAIVCNDTDVCNIVTTLQNIEKTWTKTTILSHPQPQQ